LGYEMFAGNRTDVTTVKEIVATMENRYGRADRVWVMDRGMARAANFDFLNEEGRRYILGAHRGQLKEYESELLKADWRVVHSGLEVKLVDGPDGKEVFILCRSKDRAEKERAMHDRFEQRIEEALRQMVKGCEKRKYKVKVIERRIGKLLGKNSRGAGLFDVKVSEAPLRRCAGYLDQKRQMAGMVSVERRVLYVAEQHTRLVAGRIMESLHSADGGGECFSDPQK
jgi:transposase